MSSVSIISETIDQRVIRLIPGHSRNCTFGRTDDDEGDFCTCNLRKRREELKQTLININEMVKEVCKTK